MRTKKFRAWDSINKRWCIENVLVHSSGLIMGDNDFYELDDIEPKVFLMGVEVSDYVGDVDKNGKEIYENDIVLKNDGKTKAIVYWDNNKSRWSLNPEWYGEAEDGIFCCHLQVIGNIYENPELKDW